MPRLTDIIINHILNNVPIRIKSKLESSLTVQPPHLANLNDDV